MDTTLTAHMAILGVVFSKGIVYLLLPGLQGSFDRRGRNATMIEAASVIVAPHKLHTSLYHIDEDKSHTVAG